MYIAIFFINFDLVDIYILICDMLILESSHPVVFTFLFKSGVGPGSSHF